MSWFKLLRSCRRKRSVTPQLSDVGRYAPSSRVANNEDGPAFVNKLLSSRPSFLETLPPGNAGDYLKLRSIKGVRYTWLSYSWLHPELTMKRSLLLTVGPRSVRFVAPLSVKTLP